jgi:hippurate hydrolase
VLVNTAPEAALATRVAASLFGADRVHADAAPLPASEDFAFMLQQVPGCYLMVGNGDNGHDAGRLAGPCNVHNPHFDFNDACLPVGASLWTGLVEAFFAERSR